MIAKTIVSDPIRITEIIPPHHTGKIGVTLCPGKKSPSTFGGIWDRDLAMDLTVIKREFDPTAIVTLMPDDELFANKVPTLGQTVLDHGMEWFHLPIQDMTAPDVTFDRAWPKIVPRILHTIKQGGNVLVHCKGGLVVSQLWNRKGKGGEVWIGRPGF